MGSFLRDKLGEKVIALQFTRQLKSRLGWGFLAVVDTGRFQDFSPRSAPEQWSANPLLGQMAAEQDRLQALFYAIGGSAGRSQPRTGKVSALERARGRS